MPKRAPRTVDHGDGRWHGRLDAAIAALAGAQHGVISLAQLIGLGLSASAVRDRVARGLLHRNHRGVYAVGHAALTREGRWMAAVLAYKRAALSHASPATLHGLRSSAAVMLDVTVSGNARGRAGRIRAHRSRGLLARDVTVAGRIPCTSVARTLLDIAPLVDRRGLERACDRAHNLEVFDLRAIEDVLRRCRGHRGVPPLRAVLDEHGIGTTETRSSLEEAFLSIVDAAGIRRPQADYTIDIDGEPATVDFAWITERVVVELDSWRYHGNPIAQARDARRTRGLSLLGWRVLRFTNVDLADPVAVEADVRRALALRARSA